MIVEQKSQQFDIQLNSISDANNPTRKEVEFLLHGFDISKNNTFIAKENAQKAFDTLKNMPIVAKYYSNSEPASDDDALGGHEPRIGTTRDGDSYITMETTPIGVFTDPAYIKTTEDDDGNEKEVVAGKGILWSSRFPNVVGLLQQWMDENITVSSSMEILYDEYTVKDGVEEILNFVYEGHCVLNSEDRGDHDKVQPAYDVSKLTKLVAQAMGNINEKEDKTMSENFKKMLELSHDDIRAKLYQHLDPTLNEDDFSIIVDSYDSWFVVGIENSNGIKFYKYNYTKTDNDDVEIDFDSAKEVMEKREWVEADNVQNLNSQINEKDEQIKNLQNEKNELETSKQDLETKFNEASEKITSLNSTVKELEGYKEQYNKEQYDKKYNENHEYYASKFSAVGADEKFKTDEVQDLVTKSVDDNEAVVSLNSMLVDLVEEKNNEVQKDFYELNQPRKNLVPTSDDFDSRYK